MGANLLAPFLALAAAASFALSGIFLRRALLDATPRVAALVSVTFTALFVWAVTAATVSLSPLASPRILPFVGAGVAAPGLARLVLYTGVGRVGVARASALASTAPFFAVAMAIAVLGERPAPPGLAGAAAVVAGGALLALRVREAVSWRRRDLLLPVLAALGFALRDVLSRWGLRDYPHPMIGAAAATASSVAIMWALAALGGAGAVRIRWRGLRSVVLAAVCESVAYLAMWRALALGDVAVVSPLVHANPLFTVLFVAVFLRDLERVTWRIVLASGLVVAGVGAIIGSR
jgi:uncharacterized membrane protein